MSAISRWNRRGGAGVSGAFLIVGGLAAVAGLQVHGAFSVGLLLAGFAAAGALAVVVGVLGSRSADRIAWLALAGGLLSFATGDIAFATPLASHFPSLADVGYVLAYPLLIVGAARLARSASPREATVALDSLILSLSLGLFVWHVLIEPTTAHLSAPWLATVLAIGYPVGDLVVLTLLLPLVVVRPARTVAGYLLVLAFIAIAVSDAGYGAQALRTDEAPGTLIVLGWIVGYLLLGAVALHPAGITVGTRRTRPSASLDLVRAVGVSSSVLVPPVIILWRASTMRDGSIGAEALVSLALMGLIVIRVYRTIRELTDALVRVQAEVDGRERAEARLERSDRRHERQVRRQSRERSLVAEALRAIRAGDSAEETGTAICRSLTAVPELIEAAILAFDDTPRATVLAIETATHDPLPRATVGASRSRYLRERAAMGPWVERWLSDPTHPYQSAFAGLGVAAQAFAPILRDGEPIGLLIVGSSRRGATLLLTEWLPEVVEFSGIAAALLGKAIQTRSERERLVAEVRGRILGREFRPVFQPIVDLRSGRTVGFEALTRFLDGASPELRFAEAQSVGLGAELELAAVEVALAAARTGLAEDSFLDLNVSASTIPDERLARLVAGAGRDLVLEITEHEEIRDYEAFRAAFAVIDHDARLCIDDAGSGFASLRHVVELGPDIVKLDRSLVMNIDRDDARQAAVAGMVHFAMAAGVQLVAEGIERQEELQTLRFLGVGLGQGYLLGRPEAAPESPVTVTAGNRRSSSATPDPGRSARHPAGRSAPLARSAASRTATA